MEDKDITVNAMVVDGLVVQGTQALTDKIFT